MSPSVLNSDGQTTPSPTIKSDRLSDNYNQSRIPAFIGSKDNFCVKYEASNKPKSSATAGRVIQQEVHWFRKKY